MNSAALFRRVTPAVAADAEVGLFLVAPEALDRAEAAAVFADHRAGFRRPDLLVGTGFQELADPETAGVAPITLSPYATLVSGPRNNAP